MRTRDLLFAAVSGAVLAACSGSVEAPAPAPPGSPALVPPATTTPPASTPMPAASDTVATSPVTSPSTTPPPPPACTLNTGSVACDQCSMQSCCAPISACDADPDCIAVDGCIAQCFESYGQNQAQESQCESRCVAAHPSGGQKLNALYQCMSTSCAKSCPQ